MKLINYNLPEFCFLDAHSFEGDPLENRTVLHHIRSYTIMEVISLDEVKMCDFGKHPTHKFYYKNAYGVVENFMFVLHFSLSEKEELPEIFAKCEEWYRKNIAWEDRNIRIKDIAKLN